MTFDQERIAGKMDRLDHDHGLPGVPCICRPCRAERAGTEHAGPSCLPCWLEDDTATPATGWDGTRSVCDAHTPTTGGAA